MGKLTNPCTHGQSNETLDNLTVRGVFTANAITGTGLSSGTINVGAAGTTTVTDANVGTGSVIVTSPFNSSGGLLARTKTCWVSGLFNGSFTFDVSATGAGAPAGTEQFSYIVNNEANLDE